MRRWDGLVEDYIRTCESRGLAPTTIAKRSRELERFGAWLKRRRPKPKLEQVGSDLVVDYISSRSAFHSRSTVYGVVSDLRCMGEYLERTGVWHTSPLRWMRGPKMDVRQRLPKRVGTAQLKQIWKAAESRPHEYGRYQALCILAILYGTGLRRGELERLDLDDWDAQAAVVKIDGQKTGQMRHVPLSAGAWRCVEAYLPHRHNLLEKTGRLDEPALLVNRSGQRLTGLAVSGIVSRLARCAGVEHVTLHQFRHSCASDLLEAGATLPEVQRVLGHAAIQSTVRYTAITDAARVAAMAGHPINELLSTQGRRQAS